MNTFESSSEPKESMLGHQPGYNASSAAAVQQRNRAAMLDKVQKVCYTASHWNHKESTQHGTSSTRCGSSSKACASIASTRATEQSSRAVHDASEKKQIPSKAARLDKQHGMRYTANIKQTEDRA